MEQNSAFRSWVTDKQSRARLRIGLSFRDLHVYGFTSSIQTQSTVASYALVIPRLVVAFLTRRSDAKVQILKEFDGLIRHGEMLLVLGRPGSGCTTFLKSLAGDTHGISISHESMINYTGISYERFHKSFKGESIYLAETDVHFPELTLGDTITIAAATREAQPAHVAASQQVAENVATMFALDSAFHTRIGNAMIPGCSGGEKRRASIAEALVGGAQLQCWDNSTRGLDSSTALGFVKLLRESTDELHTTVAMSIYQASDSIYQKFNTVTVLYEGRQIYFGPTRSAVQYFYELGFIKPPRATTADFLTSLTNPPERIIRDGYEQRAPRSADDFAQAWKQSAQRGQLLSEMNTFNDEHPLSSSGSQTGSEWKSKLSLRTSTYVISIYLQIVVCLRRAVQRFRRQPAPVIGAIFANAVLALVVGSVFYNLPETSDNMDKRAVLIFFSVLVTALSPAFEVLTIWAQRPIVEKHNRYAFYHPFTDAAASMICDLPNKFATAVLFQIVIYFMTNLRRTPGPFFVWFLFNIVLVLNMSMWFRLIGSISRTMEQSTAPTCILVLLWCIYAGFVVPIPYMVDWLKWFRFVNPIAYAYESLMINEASFQSRRFPCSTLVPDGPTYSETALENRICTVVGAVAGQSYVEGNIYLAWKYEYFPIHLWRNLGILIAMTIIVCILHLLCAQYIPAERSKGDILRFRHAPGLLQQNLDTEAGASSVAVQNISAQNDYRNSVAEKDPIAKQSVRMQSSLFHWSDLSYEVKIRGGKTKRILNRIDGWVKPGNLTALMGVSGAGKTTLLDVLANRANFGIFSGKVGIEGRERDASFQRRIGYAQQEDIHLPTATVREALEFSALLRQSEASVSERLNYVNEVLQILDLGSYADAVVGIPGDGLNIEQRKRLTIGVELVARPDFLLFLDEPTSGLDSQTAWSICMLLRNLANSGHTVLCTIHQPSSQLFLLFDRLLLLNNQGQTLYFGDVGQDASTMIDYFEEHGAKKCDKGANPAEWMLTVSNTTPDIATDTTTDTITSDFWADKWSTSRQRATAIQRIPELHTNAVEVPPEMNRKEYAASWFSQLNAVTKRRFQEYWRSPTYVYSKVALCAGVALFNGLSFQNTRLDIQGLQNIIFSMFLLTQMFGTVDQQVIPRLIDGRALFEARERRSKTYSWTVFLASNILVELVWQTLAAVLVFVLWYYPTGLWRHGDHDFGSTERGALTFVIIWLYCLWIVTFSQAVAAGIEHAESAVQLATLIFWFSLVFCGALVSPHDLPRFWTFVWRASPLTYLIDGLALAGLANVDIACSPSQFLVMEPPEGRDCASYLATYIQQAGGTLSNPLEYENCQYCPISTANSYLYGGLAVGSGSPWNNVGYFTVFNSFNILATFALYWLPWYLASGFGEWCLESP
ncbi:hypothetical protein NUW58_g161 [Xylaria curta]|uniref:Uncharacterized protein n=1 Tax=Xylaria curta TaxID=42375 RepID=A0ACC1PSB4_9PEZI|nr:hypothetical protein NUW58_g161 [Xylaria curta]